jgi:hypothetical protein
MTRKLPTHSLADWQRNKPQAWHVTRALDALRRSVPTKWRTALDAAGLGQIESDGPEWLNAYDALQAVEKFDADFGQASRWELDDAQICGMAKRLAYEVGTLDACALREGLNLQERVDSIYMLIRAVGVREHGPLAGEAGIKRTLEAAWWRRVLRRHVARVVEAGEIRLGLVNRRDGGYVSNKGLQRRAEQVLRNAATLKRTLYRNEAGQVFNLGELSALSNSNPVIRGGELMTRIRGAEEYADRRQHIGLFLTMTVPSRFHPVKLVNGGKLPVPNKRYDGRSTPRDAQKWLCKRWSRLRAYLDRRGVHLYGIRVAEPHHDATPHWHAMVWVEDEEQLQKTVAGLHCYWLSDDGDEPGAGTNRINIKRLVGGGAAGYVAKYIAKSVGHAALADHLDVVQGELFDVETCDMPGHRRVDAWAATWGIRQFQAIGMPAVTVWRELRRVTEDQAEDIRIGHDGDMTTWRAWVACHRWGKTPGTIEGGGVSRADWCRFMEAMGGHCRKRGQWHMGLARRRVPLGTTNAYGEEVTQGPVVGLETQQGRWLVSRRMAWRPMVHEALGAAPAAADAPKLDAPATEPTQSADRAPLAPAWTRFNNCTARIGNSLQRQLFGRGRHEKEDWTPGSPTRSDAEWRALGTSPTPFY